ncbi:MAG: hypothetical protein A2152_02030 [Candidatus Levybacteria bacterium RBG_16_35_6]|nr:MAG: hypothetical protein A2152_02030 [Candidatus Levybacteria bacterium RBG_16_35_6]
MKKIIFGAIFSVVTLAFVVAPAFAVKPADKGFDQYGYNYQARVFVGAADGVDRTLNEEVWGDPTYANDHLVMKWSKAWDDARFNGAPWTPEAWVDNEWNGVRQDGSGWTEHAKIIWVGPGLGSSPYWREGGTAIWGEFEIIMDQGIDPTQGHQWWTQVSPAGYGGPN